MMENLNGLCGVESMQHDTEDRGEERGAVVVGGHDLLHHADGVEHNHAHLGAKVAFH